LEKAILGASQAVWKNGYFGQLVWKNGYLGFLDLERIYKADSLSARIKKGSNSWQLHWKVARSTNFQLVFNRLIEQKSKLHSFFGLLKKKAAFSYNSFLKQFKKPIKQ